MLSLYTTKMTSNVLDDLESFTVSIALETNYHQDYCLEGSSNVKQPNEILKNALPQRENEISSNFRIGPPAKASEYYIEVDSQLQVSHLTPFLIKQLELRLNPCALGTLKNWEYVCASLGSSTDEIVNLRRAESPTMAFLRIYKVSFIFSKINFIKLLKK